MPNKKYLKTINNLLQSGLTFHKTGRLQEAKNDYESIINIDPDNVDALNLLGTVSEQLGSINKSIDYYHKAIQLNPNIGALYFNLGRVYKIQKQTSKAIENYKKSISLNDHDVKSYLNLASIYYELNQLENAINCNKQAISISPDSADAYHNLGLIYHLQGQYIEAINYYTKTISIKNDYADAYNNMGVAQSDIDKPETAISFFKKAISLQSNFLDAYANLAETYEKMNEIEKAQTVVSKALDLDPEDPKLIRLSAKLLSRVGNNNEAINLLKKINISNLNSEIASSICFEIGKSYDQISKTNQAMHYFIEGNTIQANNKTPLSVDKKQYLNQLIKIENYFSHKFEKISSAPASNTIDKNLVFLVGFPRSGTTLLDQILNSHSKIQVLEEKNMIDNIIDQLNTIDEGYPDSITSLKKNDIDRFIKEYFHEANKYIDGDGDGDGDGDSIIIDKMPLHIANIGLINKLFPQSKIILSIRHPYDVCLSNFMQNYKLTNAMANFSTLEDTANIYDMVMRIWQKYVELLPINYHIIKYELLVNDFESNVKDLLKFLNLEWESSVLNYMDHAKKRGKINTPSYSQVIEPINKKAIYRWKYYKEHLEPIFTKLKPHIDYFEY